MSLYADYIKEREGYDIAETEKGFATYTLFPETKSCYIRDIFVQKPFRKENIASELADSIAERARALGYTQLLGSVDPGAAGATTSLKVLLGYGFHLSRVEGTLIIFSKQI